MDDGAEMTDRAGSVALADAPPRHATSVDAGARAGAPSEPDAARLRSLRESVETYTDLIHQVFRLNGQLIAHGDEIGRDENLTSARWQVLGTLAPGPRTVAQLARDMEISRQGLRGTVCWLVDAGLAEMIDNPNHRRAKLVRLTEAGEDARRRLRPRQTAWATAIVEEFSHDDLQHALSVLKQIRVLLGRGRGPAGQGGDGDA